MNQLMQLGQQTVVNARGRQHHHLHVQTREAMEEYFALCMIANYPTSEHLATLRRLAADVAAVAELGTWHGDSAFAFMMGAPDTMICVDQNPCKYPQALEAVAEYNGVAFQFLQEDTREVDLPEVDLLFVDSDHTYEQVHAELTAHIDQVRRYLVFHDTDTCFPVRQAIKEVAGQHFDLVEQYHNAHGLWVMERKGYHE